MKTKKVFIVSSPVADKGDLLRRRIRDVSRDLFLKYGYAPVSVDEISSRLGISKATLYREFRGKKDILVEVVESIKTDMLAGVERIAADEKSDSIEKLVRLMSFVGNNLSRVGALLLRDLRKNAPEVWEDLNRFRKEKILQNFGALIENGVREGAFKPDIRRDLAVRMFMTLIQEFINPDAVLNSPYSARDIFETAVRLFLEGILSDGGRHEFTSRKLSLYPQDKEVF
jgi:TetR/AcrR family transcriptional regulator, transcriptional repressor of aconitase